MTLCQDPNQIYYPGDQVFVPATFTDAETGAVADPDAVTFVYKNPDGSLSTFVFGTDPEVVKKSTGVYQCEAIVNQSGTYYVKVSGSGGITKSVEIQFQVQPSKVS